MFLPHASPGKRSRPRGPLALLTTTLRAAPQPVAAPACLLPALERARACSGCSIAHAGRAASTRPGWVRPGFPLDVGRLADGTTEIANREFCGIFALGRGRWHSLVPPPRVNRAPRADFTTSPKSSETCQTVWRRGGDSNPRNPFESTRVPGVRLKPGSATSPHANAIMHHANPRGQFVNLRVRPRHAKPPSSPTGLAVLPNASPVPMN